MAKTEFKLVRKPRAPKVQYRIIRGEVAKKLEPIAKAGVIARRRVVANWKNKPDWQYRIKVRPEAIRVIIALTRPKPVKDSNINTNTLWKFIDKGTKPHPIRARRKPLLKFKSGGKGSYQSKTGANPARFGGPGTVSNAQWISKKEVKHPGFSGREFEKAINKDLRPKFNNAIDAGYRAGFKKLKSS